MRFGRFLVDRGFITLEHLFSALDMQIERQVPLGKLALKAGFLTMKQVMEVVSAQDGPAGEDRLFGELAIELGYMNGGQLIELLQSQRQTRLPIGEVLVSMGVLEAKVLQRQLKHHKALHEGLTASAETIS